MKRIIASLVAAASLLLAAPAQAATPQHVEAVSTGVEQYLYVTLTVHFSKPVPTSVSRITATGYAGKCVHLHCTYAQFVLVPYNVKRTVWIDTEVVPTDAVYTVTSVQLVPVAVGWPTKLVFHTPIKFRTTTR